MGKKLVIKGADFSANALNEIIWYSAEYLRVDDSDSVPSAAVFAIEDNTIFIGKPINKIRVKVKTPGILTVGIVDGLQGDSHIVTSRQIDLSNATPGELAVATFDPFTPASGQFVFVQGNSDTCIFRFWGDYDEKPLDSQPFVVNVASGSATSINYGSLCIDFGYEY